MTGKEFYPIQAHISGKEIESRLLEVARVGLDENTDLLPPELAPNRLALSIEDFEGRLKIHELMTEAGLDVDDSHPLFVRATLPGNDRSLSPVMVLSHYDTVPEADIYDGVTGLVGGIAVASAVKKSGIMLERDVEVLALTGEESSRFKRALFGSTAAFQGLSEEDLLMADEEGRRIMDEISDSQAEDVMDPAYGPEFWQLKKPFAAIELHVEQNDVLEKSWIDLGVVDTIAAPTRHEISIGGSDVPTEEKTLEFSGLFSLFVHGKADHSGATPMGDYNRLDGLVETANIVLPAISDHELDAGLQIIGVDVKNQALNKIPGLVETVLRVCAATKAEYEEKVKKFTEIIEEETHATLSPSDYENPKPLDAQTMTQRFRSAFEIVLGVNAAAESHSNDNVVGTVGTIDVSRSGEIKLGLDVRGIDNTSRESAMEKIVSIVEKQSEDYEVKISDPLPGSGLPVEMDKRLVERAVKLIENKDIGSCMVMYSPAGHDAQNAARAGVPTVMLFVPSKDGIAHNPNAYTSPEQLEKGVKALAALVVDLANSKSL